MVLGQGEHSVLSRVQVRGQLNQTLTRCSTHSGDIEGIDVIPQNTQSTVSSTELKSSSLYSKDL